MTFGDNFGLRYRGSRTQVTNFCLPTLSVGPVRIFMEFWPGQLWSWDWSGKGLRPVTVSMASPVLSSTLQAVLLPRDCLSG